jgi:hypothetical protein
MLVSRGLGILANPVLGDTLPVAAPAPTMSSSWDRPWQCQWVPFYAQWNPSVCQNYANPAAPAAPVVPIQNSDGTYSVDQVVGDTAAAQQQQTSDFFWNVSDQLGLNPATCAPESFWCNYGSWLLFGGVALAVLYGAHQVKGWLR